MQSARTRALYAGSFDPITRGHLDIVEKALTIFDIVHVAVGLNPVKTGLFDADERVQLIFGATKDLRAADAALETATALAGAAGAPIDRVEVGSFAGESIVRYARRIGATHVVRGLRQASDFNDEFRYHGMFGRLDPMIHMVHFFCREDFLHVSSSAARELASLGEDVGWVVTPAVAEALHQKFLRERS